MKNVYFWIFFTRIGKTALLCGFISLGIYNRFHVQFSYKTLQGLLKTTAWVCTKFMKDFRRCENDYYIWIIKILEPVAMKKSVKSMS